MIPNLPRVISGFKGVAPEHLRDQTHLPQKIKNKCVRVLSGIFVPGRTSQALMIGKVRAPPAPPVSELSFTFFLVFQLLQAIQEMPTMPQFLFLSIFFQTALSFSLYVLLSCPVPLVFI